MQRKISILDLRRHLSRRAGQQPELGLHREGGVPGWHIRPKSARGCAPRSGPPCVLPPPPFAAYFVPASPGCAASKSQIHALRVVQGCVEPARTTFPLLCAGAQTPK
eukprot:419626-Rhodomonas_salina.2